MVKNSCRKLAIFTVLVMLFSGCTNTSVPSIYDGTISTSVEATSDTSINQDKYTKCYLMMTQYDAKSIKGKQYMAFFKDSFATAGIEIVSDKNKANCLLFEELNASSDTFTTSTPLWGRTGISSATTTPNYTGGFTTNYQPSYGITGYIPKTNFIGKSTLAVSARTKSGEEIWKVVVNITKIMQNTNDIERTIGPKVLPVLINAAAVSSRKNEKVSWGYSELELNLLLQHRAKEIMVGKVTRLHPLSEKVSDINTVANWNICEGEKTTDVLTRWAERVGYKFEMNNTKIRSKEADNDQPYQGKFTDVLSQYLSPQRLKPVLDTKNKTLSVTDWDE